MAGRKLDGMTCGIGIDQGTSMATPLAAAAAVLIRQYFTDGWYPTSAADPNNAYNPSAALLKAVMLGELPRNTSDLMLVGVL